MPNRYNILQALYSSFYSRQLYQDVVKRWGGFAFIYLLLVSAITILIFIFLIHSRFNHFATTVASKLPTVSIDKGVISTPENKPYRIMDPDSQEVIAIIDTSGHYQTLDEAKTDILITKTQIITKQNESVVKTYTIPTSFSKVFDQETINYYLDKMMIVMLVVMYFVITFVYFVYLIVLNLIYSIVGKLFALLTSNKLSYANILLVSMVAMTPSQVLTIFQYVFELTIPYKTLISLLLVFAYLFYGIAANKQEQVLPPQSNAN